MYLVIVVSMVTMIVVVTGYGKTQETGVVDKSVHGIDTSSVV